MRQLLSQNSPHTNTLNSALLSKDLQLGDWVSRLNQMLELIRVQQVTLDRNLEIRDNWVQAIKDIAWEKFSKRIDV